MVIPRDKAARDALTDARLSYVLATSLRDARRARGFSQAELARRAGLAVSTIVHLEDPRRPKTQSTSTLARLAAALDTAVAVRFVPWSSTGSPEDDHD